LRKVRALRPYQRVVGVCDSVTSTPDPDSTTGYYSVAQYPLTSTATTSISHAPEGHSHEEESAAYSRVLDSKTAVKLSRPQQPLAALMEGEGSVTQPGEHTCIIECGASTKTLHNPLGGRVPAPPPSSGGKPAVQRVGPQGRGPTAQTEGSESPSALPMMRKRGKFQKKCDGQSGGASPAPQGIQHRLLPVEPNGSEPEKKTSIIRERRHPSTTRGLGATLPSASQRARPARLTAPPPTRWIAVSTVPGGMSAPSTGRASDTQGEVKEEGRARLPARRAAAVRVIT